MEPKFNRYMPWRWTLLTWAAVLFWLWTPFVLNYPPSFSYELDPTTNELSDPIYYDGLGDLPFPCGWPLHYVCVDGFCFDSRVNVPLLVGATPLPLAPNRISYLAMTTNFLLVAITLTAVVYLLQRCAIRFSVLAFLCIVSAYFLSLRFGAILSSFDYSFLGPTYHYATYFWPVPAAIAVYCFGVPSISNVRKFAERLRSQSAEPPTIDDFQSAEDAMAAASKIAYQGKWESSIELYRESKIRWPEHCDYIENCIAEIESKREVSANGA